MKILKSSYIRYFFIVTFTFCLASCASKNDVTVNKKAATEEYSKDSISEKNLLYLVDGKQVSSDYIKEINSNDIEKITVIKGEKDVRKYTDKEYDGVIIIEMKKK